MSNTSKQKRFRWLLTVAVLTATSNGCASWNHHVGKHSMLSYFHKKHHSPYTQCEDCGQIIMNDRYHQCNQCTPKPAFYGFKSTCWNAWPLGWSPCPAPATNSCLINGESVVLADVDQLDNSASTETPSQDKTEYATSSIVSEPELKSEVNVEELEPDLGVDSSTDNDEEDPTEMPIESAESEEPFDAENVTSIVEEDVVYIEKTTPAINTSFELPSVARSIPPVPVTPAPVPVAPASAMVTTLDPAELIYSETSSDPVVSAAKSRLHDLKHFLKEARSTALHLSHAKKPDGQESERSLEFSGSQSVRSDSLLDQNSLEDAVQTEQPTQPIALVTPVSLKVPTTRKVSLLDRLCPKSAN